MPLKLPKMIRPVLIDELVMQTFHNEEQWLAVMSYRQRHQPGAEALIGGAQ